MHAAERAASIAANLKRSPAHRLDAIPRDSRNRLKIAVAVVTWAAATTMRL